MSYTQFRKWAPQFSIINSGIFKDSFSFSLNYSDSARKHRSSGCSLSTTNSPLKGLGEYLERYHLFEDTRVDGEIQLSHAPESFKSFIDEGILPKYEKNFYKYTKCLRLNDFEDVIVPSSTLSLKLEWKQYEILHTLSCSTGSAIHNNYKSSFDSAFAEMNERQNLLLFWNGLEPINVSKLKIDDLLKSLQISRNKYQIIDFSGEFFLLNCSFIGGLRTVVLIYTAVSNDDTVKYSISSSSADSFFEATKKATEELLLTNCLIYDVSARKENDIDIYLDEYDANFIASNNIKTINRFNFNREKNSNSKLFFNTTNFSPEIDEYSKISDIYHYSHIYQIEGGKIYFSKVFGPDLFTGLNYYKGRKPKILDYFNISVMRKELIPFP